MQVGEGASSPIISIVVCKMKNTMMAMLVVASSRNKHT